MWLGGPAGVVILLGNQKMFVEEVLPLATTLGTSLHHINSVVDALQRGVFSHNSLIIEHFECAVS